MNSVQSVPTATLSDLQVSSFSQDPHYFSLDDTLASGQCFRWKRQPGGWWTGVVGDSVIGIRQTGPRFDWWTYPEPNKIELIQDYFQLSTNMAEIVRSVSEADPAAGEAAKRWSGLRLVRQDPEECILSFVCSTANSVPRIVYSIGRFSEQFGNPLAEIDGALYYTFPRAATLAQCDVAHLTRISSLGFRGTNLVKVAKQIDARGSDWATSLRAMEYEEAHRALVELNGIGAKIADCVCLFALDKTEAVPVDTHVWQLAKDLYFPDWPARKSLTNAAYNTVAGAFRDRFGSLAGYAQNFLFYDHFSNHWGGTSPLLK